MQTSVPPSDSVRRDFLRQVLRPAGLACGASLLHLRQLSAAEHLLANEQFSPDEPGHTTLRERQLGLLIGALIGDALGGPVEFADRDKVRHVTASARDWPEDRKLDATTLRELSVPIDMPSYAELRPQPAPYGQWPNNAPPGTITDDSRHKIVLQRAFRTAISQSRLPVDQDIARSFLSFRCIANTPDAPEIGKLNEEGFREYRYASHWLLGERAPDKARPLSRLWAGVNNCSGQMMFLGLAAAFPDQPSRAYRACYELDFIDAPIARDICSALVAALASVLSPDNPSVGKAVDRQDRIDQFESSLRNTDPFQYDKVPFAGRQLHRWLDLVERIVTKADGSPKRLYELLETDGKPVFWWDAHFTLLVPLCILKLCKYDSLAAMHLCLDFGHDTDSYAQVLGAIIGALDGVEVFPVSWRAPVTDRLKQDYQEDLNQWCDEFDRLADLSGGTQDKSPE